MFVRRKKIRLHVHLLDLQLAGRDALVDPLVRRIEATRVADHADQAGLLLQLIDGLGILPAVGERNLDLHVLAGLHALDRLLRVHLRRRAQDHRVHVRLRQRLAQLRRRVRDAVLLRDFLRRRELPADERHDFDAVDLLHAHRDASGRTRRRLRPRPSSPRSPGSCGPPPCSTPARDRSDAPRATCASSAPRMISHITSSMPSEPASRMYRRAASARAIPDRVTSCRGTALSNSLLMSPARGPCSWWLMPPVPQICTLRFVVERIDGAADRPAELIAAIARRRRVLHDVDRERNHLARPRLRLPEHQRQRHGEAVIDVHAIDDREIEVGLDHATARCAPRAPDAL